MFHGARARRANQTRDPEQFHQKTPKEPKLLTRGLPTAHCPKLCPMRQTTLLLLVLPLVHPLAPPGHRLLARPRWEHARVARHAVERDQDGALDLVEYCEVTTQPDVCAFDAQETAAQPLARDVSMRELLAFSGPAVALYLNSPLLSLIDSAAVGRGAALTAGGTLELAALGPATAVADTYITRSANAG